MKRNRILWLLCFLFAGGLLFYACQQEEVDIPLEDPLNNGMKHLMKEIKNPEVRKAMEWYDINCTNHSLSRSVTAEHPLFKNMVPAWAYAFVREKENRIAIEIPVEARSHRIFTLAENAIAYEETGNSMYIHSLTRMVILTDKSTGRTRGFFMTQIPTKKYMDAKNFRVYSSTYLKRAEDFDGYIYFHDLDGSFLNGWQYTDGKITYSIKEAKTEEKNTKTLSRSDGHYEEITICEPMYEMECTTYYRTDEYGNKVIDDIDCVKKYVGDNCVTKTIWIPGEPDPDEGEVIDSPCTHPKCMICGGCTGIPESMLCVPCTCFDVQISSSAQEVELLSSYQLTVKVTPNAAGLVGENIVGNCIIEMSCDDGINWTTVSNGLTLSYSRMSQNPKTWKIRAKVTSNTNITKTSNEIIVKEIYPSYETIISNNNIRQRFDEIWEITKDFAKTSQKTRREYGCWVYIDTKNKRYFCGDTIHGREVDNTTVQNSSVPVKRPDQTILKSNNPKDYIVDYVAFFHTHTPVTYANVYRSAGPSPSDIDWSNNNNCPGILYEYNAIENGQIPPGHPLNASASIRSFGIKRREL